MVRNRLTTSSIRYSWRWLKARVDAATAARCGRGVVLCSVAYAAIAGSATARFGSTASRCPQPSGTDVDEHRVVACERSGCHPELGQLGLVLGDVVDVAIRGRAVRDDLRLALDDDQLTTAAGAVQVQRHL